MRESQKQIFMKKANDAWKKFKSKLRVNLKDGDVGKWKEKVPRNVKSEDWEVFCNNEALEVQKTLRRKNKETKQNCVRKTTHNTGRHGYARASENWRKEHGRAPTRAELWLATHIIKGGGYAPHDKIFAVI